jgi:hypothetical protein
VQRVEYGILQIAPGIEHRIEQSVGIIAGGPLTIGNRANLIP